MRYGWQFSLRRGVDNGAIIGILLPDINKSPDWSKFETEKPAAELEIFLFTLNPAGPEPWLEPI